MGNGVYGPEWLQCIMKNDTTVWVMGMNAFLHFSKQLFLKSKHETTNLAWKHTSAMLQVVLGLLFCNTAVQSVVNNSDLVGNIAGLIGSNQRRVRSRPLFSLKVNASLQTRSKLFTFVWPTHLVHVSCVRDAQLTSLFSAQVWAEWQHACGADMKTRTWNNKTLSPISD